LDEFEQKNIESAVAWTLNRNHKLEEILSEKFILEIHKRMFGEVWKWAGKFRKSNKNIGVDKFQIQTELRKLIDDCRYWTDQKVFEPDEITVRFKHRLVQIHLFPNGNGRHSRLCADILISQGLKMPIFTWGRNNLSKWCEFRKKYLEAIYAADGGDYKLLIEFARS
jgi:Fic-DOC domain mobile mystery protein B